MGDLELSSHLKPMMGPGCPVLTPPPLSWKLVYIWAVLLSPPPPRDLSLHLRSPAPCSSLECSISPAVSLLLQAVVSMSSETVALAPQWLL